MTDRNITVVNLSNGTVVLYDPDTRMNIRWEKKGAKRKVSLEKLKEAIWNQGVAALFTDGFLKIEESDAKNILVELELEEEDATPEEQHILVLTDIQRKRLLTTAPFGEFKETFNKLGLEQRQQLADYAIENKLIDFEKCDYIKNGIGTDIISAVRLSADDEK